MARPASIPSHQNEADKALHFPADGNAQLVKFVDQRVHVTGSASRKTTGPERGGSSCVREGEQRSPSA